MNWDLLHNCIYHFWVLRTSFLESSEWLLLEIKTYNCVRLKPRQCTQVCTPIQTDLLKPENSLLKYGNNHYFRGVRKKKFHSKIFKFVAGKKWRMKTNFHIGSPNILLSSLCRRGRGEQVLKVASKGHYKRRRKFVDKQLNINIDKSLVVKMTCCWFLCLHFFMCGTMSANHIGMQIKMWMQQLLSTGANLDMVVTSG